MESQTGPDSHHAAETEGGTDGVETDAGMIGKDFEDGNHQSLVTSDIVAFHLWNNLEGECHAEQHYSGSDEEHLSPA